MTGPNLLEVREISAIYPGGVQALKQIEFDVPAGQFVSIVGPSGCGKSTLLRIIAGLLQPTAGAVLINGRKPVEARRNATRLSFVFQDATLLPWRNIVDNVALPLELEGVGRKNRTSAAQAELQRVGLSDVGERYPRQLSGGMRMRAALARALVTQPEVLLLDEPFGALDDITRQLLNEELQSLWSQRRFTAIFVTHNIAEAVFLSQRILMLTPRPGMLAAEVASSFPFPRAAELRGQPDFARLVQQVSSELRRTAA